MLIVPVAPTIMGIVIVTPKSHAKLTIPVIVGATGTINIFHEQIHNHM
jgi:hypothetical protein